MTYGKCFPKGVLEKLAVGVSSPAATPALSFHSGGSPVLNRDCPFPVAPGLHTSRPAAAPASAPPSIAGIAIAPSVPAPASLKPVAASRSLTRPALLSGATPLPELLSV